MAPQDNMSHAEIWDDSALVDSWNDALEEYKVAPRSSQKPAELTSRQKYHSIQARGENVEDVLKSAETQSNGL